MKTRTPELITVAAIIAFVLIAPIPSYAQITISLPQIPKIFKEKPEAKPAPSPVVSKESDPASAISETSESYISDPNRVVKEEPRVTARDCESDGRTSFHLMEIEKVIKEAQSWVPSKSTYFAGMLAGPKNEYIEAAIYPKAREELFAKQSERGPKCITPALNELAAIARQKIPMYTGPTGYINGTAAEKKLLLSTVSDVNLAKIHGAGLLQTNWVIAKDNFNFPTARYKHGMFIAKYPTREFCWVFYVNIVQDYAGGGTYGASYANFIGRVISGCPAGK
jgi:hypothetical protein